MNRQTSHTQQKSDDSEAITTAVKYDKNDNKRFETDANGNVIINTYDGLNRLETVTDAVYHTTTNIYDANGNLIETTNWRGNSYDNVYDPLNRLIEKVDPFNVTIQTLNYNDDGAQIKSYDALNNLTQYTYDKNNRLLETADPRGDTTSQAYDNVGNIQTKTDARGKATTYSYDEFNRLESVTNAKDETTNYTYDLNGNMLTQTDAKNNTTAYEYNCSNKAKKMTDANGKEENYTYNSDGSMAEKTDRNGITTAYEYDIHGRLLSQQTGDISIEYTYDNNGNQLTMEDQTGTTQREYDALNRVTRKTVPEIGTTYYDYDIIESSGKVAERTTDPRGNATKKVYDKAGRLYKVEADGDATLYSYYDNGRLESVDYPDGSVEQYTYYDDNLLHTLTNRKPSGEIIDNYSYSYDAAHNQTSKADNKGTTNYEYDDLNRLNKVSEPNEKVTEYTFDLAGNRATESVTQSVYDEVYGDSYQTFKLTAYNYDNLNRLLSTQTTVDGADTEYVTFMYDDNGNELSVAKSVYDDVYNQNMFTTINTFDSLNRLKRIQTPEGKVIDNEYNGEGIRVSKKVDEDETKYLYEADKVILELDGRGNQTARNVQGTNLISRTAGDKTGYFFYNGHGDVTTVTEAVYGDVLANYYYDAFGNIETVQGSVYDSVYGSSFPNPFRFAGYMYDEETGTYYLMARFYDPETGRFLSEDDPKYTNPQDELSLNLYTYCHNEPIMYTDPDGHDPLEMKWITEKIDEQRNTWRNTQSEIDKLRKTESMASKAYWTKLKLLKQKQNVAHEEADLLRNQLEKVSNPLLNSSDSSMLNKKTDKILSSSGNDNQAWKDYKKTLNNLVDRYKSAQNLSVQMYVRTPNRGDREVVSLLGGSGHSFVSINFSDGTKRVFGFYSTESDAAKLLNGARSKVIDNRVDGKENSDEVSHYDATIQGFVSAERAQNAFNYAYDYEIGSRQGNSNNNYIVDKNNCTTFAVNTLNAAGVNHSIKPRDWKISWHNKVLLQMIEKVNVDKIRKLSGYSPSNAYEDLKID